MFLGLTCELKTMVGMTVSIILYLYTLFYTSKTAYVNYTLGVKSQKMGGI